MFVQILNVDMASQDIPSEDEITEQGENNITESEGHSSAAEANVTPQPSTTASDQSSADSSNEVAKMEKNDCCHESQT